MNMTLNDMFREISRLDEGRPSESSHAGHFNRDENVFGTWGGTLMSGRKLGELWCCGLGLK